MCGRNMLYLVVETLLALAILGACSCSRPNSARKSGYTEECRVTISDHEDDDDVQAERHRVESGAACSEVLQMRDLRKEYPDGKVALERMSLGVGAGCFGFLGENGAGKTTTIKMLTSDISPSGGHASIAGFDVVSDRINSRRMLGYCPQFDALLENLTVREHLALFAEIKGIPSSHCAGEAEALIDLMALDNFKDTLAHQLSGGNKRKLCAAIALLGGPKLVVLDEPSTGMDVVARRSMWGVIRELIAGGCTVMLVTHLMEECEALCSRVGVLIGGRLRCLGSPQHLKSRFGRNEFYIHMKLPISSDSTSISQDPTHQLQGMATSVSNFLKGRFEQAEVTGVSQHQISIVVKSTQPLSSVLAAVQMTKDTHGIVECSVGQTSLEQIFNSLVAENQAQST